MHCKVKSKMKCSKSNHKDFHSEYMKIDVRQCSKSICNVISSVLTWGRDSYARAIRILEKSYSRVHDEDLTTINNLLPFLPHTHGTCLLQPVVQTFPSLF